jgi:hypothetical protein
MRKKRAAIIQIFFFKNQFFKFSKLKIYLASLNKKKGPQNSPPALSSFSKAESEFSIFSPRTLLALFHSLPISSKLIQLTLALLMRIKLYIQLIN